jgi:hypothetical protein
VSFAELLDNNWGGFNLYPNPTNGEITFSFGEKLSLVSIDILDTKGRIILKQDVKNSAFAKIVMTDVNGIYFARVKSDLGTKTVRIVKQ